MYTGHVAVALATRGVRRDIPLWALVLAAQACDWVELVVYPFTPRTTNDVYSHAYPFVVIAAPAVAAAMWLWKRSVSAAVTVALVYLSHPLLDYVTGYKPLWLGGPNMGLEVIQRPAADFAVQALVCVVGFAVYWRSLAPTRRRQTVSMAPLLLLLVLQGLSDLRLESNRRRRERRRERLSHCERPLELCRPAASAYHQSPPLRVDAHTLGRPLLVPCPSGNNESSEPCTTTVAATMRARSHEAQLTRSVPA